MTLPEIIKHLLIQDKTHEAIKQINQLSQQELEAQDQVTQGYLFDFAIRHSSDPDVFHAFITQYAKLTGNTALCALTLDCHPTAFNHLDIAFIMGKLPIMRHEALNQYKSLMNLQKIIYCHRIMNEVKKLSIYGAKLLLEVLNPPQKGIIEKAIIHYEVMFINDKEFNTTLNANEPADTTTVTFRKARIIQKIAFELMTMTGQFLNNDRQPLSSYQSAAREMLHSQQAIMQTCRGLGKIVRDIGNAIAHYTGLSLLVSLSQGKVNEFQAGRWTLFSNRSKTQQHQETILNVIDVLPPLANHSF